MQKTKEFLENRQISIYFGAVILAAITVWLTPATTVLAANINWVLAFMLFVTFLQVPITDLWRAFTQIRFLTALPATNFIVLPFFLMLLVQLLPEVACKHNSQDLQTPLFSAQIICKYPPERTLTANIKFRVEFSF